MMQRNIKNKKPNTVKRVLGIILLFFISFSLLSMIAASLVFNAVFQRREDDPYELKMQYSVKDEAAYPRESISFLSGGQTIRGNIYSADNPSGIVIMVNGFQATGSSHLAEIFYFVDDGWAVLSFDGTGVGNSDGESVVGLEQGRRDVLAAIDYVAGSPRWSGMPIFLYGHSAGGYAVSTLCDDSRVCAAVSISGFDSPRSMMKLYGEEYVGVLADISYPFLCAYDKLLFGRDGGVSAHTHIENAKCPVLIVQGTADEVVPFEQSIYYSCLPEYNSNVQLALIEETYRNRHSTAWLTADAARDFLQLQRQQELAESAEPTSNTIQTLQENAVHSDEVLRQVDVDFLQSVSLFFRQALYK